jgi:hypothetical protein
MAVTLYKIEEGRVAPRVPDFLRGEFFELHLEPKYDDNNQLIDTYVGWIHFRSDGTVEVGEPGA